jgi:hypothetical protein
VVDYRGGNATAESKTAECAEKLRLLHDYQVALADLSRAVQVLLKTSRTMRKTKYMKIRAYSETARLKAESARKELDRHTYRRAWLFILNWIPGADKEDSRTAIVHLTEARQATSNKSFCSLRVTASILASPRNPAQEGERFP